MYRRNTTSSPILSGDEDADELTVFLRGATLQVWNVCCPILFGVSTLAHTLSMVVLSSKSVRCSNNGVYLAVMSVVNILILNVGLLRQWLRFSSFQIDIVKHFGPVVCKILVWLVYWSIYYSMWVLVVHCCVRTRTVYQPNVVETRRKQTELRFNLGLISVLLLILNSHFLYGFSDLVFNRDDNTTTTPVSDDYVHLLANFWAWFPLVLLTIVPFITTAVVSGYYIAYKVWADTEAAHRERLLSTTTSRPGRKLGKVLSLTAMLSAPSAALLITSTPLFVFILVRVHVSKLQETETVSAKTAAMLDLWEAVMNQVMYADNSIVFLFRCLSEERFRQELRDMFHRWHVRGDALGFQCQRTPL